MKTFFRATVSLVIVTSSLYGQSGSINNTLGTGGLFTIKDNSTTFLKLSQSSGLLSFSSALGDKISLWGSSGPHYGFGIQSAQLQIYTDLAGSDVVFGYGTSGAFTETMRIKGNGNVGIGISTPNAPLSFPPALGKKITLYPGASGDVGFGVAGNRLQIYSDNPNADVAIGYDAAGTFNERFAVKPDGALAINGNVGAAGQLLSSNGSGAAASWVTPAPTLYNSSWQFVQSSTLSGFTNYVGVPGLSQNITSPAGKAMIILKGLMRNNGCFACGEHSCKYDILVDGVLIDRHLVYVGNGVEAIVTNGAVLYDVSAGTHTITVNVDGNGGNFDAYSFRIVVVVFPQ